MASDSAAFEISKKIRTFDGILHVCSHASSSTKTKMTFAVFLPAAASPDARVPVLYFLSGLTCTWENFMTKAGGLAFAAKHNIAIVCPDTSPRGAGIEGESDAWDFGVGAGFYVNASEAKWAPHYNMFTYVTSELPTLLAGQFPSLDTSRASITGHSMGGHGALICALRCPGVYRSVSAFAPISHPSACPWGQKAFTGYLGADSAAWREWDATELVARYTGPALHVLIDQGEADEFYVKKQLLPEDLVAAAAASPAVKVQLNMRAGYDHSYYFISTFIGDHVAHHAAHLHA